MTYSTFPCAWSLYSRPLSYSLQMQTVGLPHFIRPLGLLLWSPVTTTLFQAFLGHSFTSSLHCWPKEGRSPKKQKQLHEVSLLMLHALVCGRDAEPLWLNKTLCKTNLQPNHTGGWDEEIQYWTFISSNPVYVWSFHEFIHVYVCSLFLCFVYFRYCFHSLPQ